MIMFPFTDTSSKKKAPAIPGQLFNLWSFLHYSYDTDYHRYYAKYKHNIEKISAIIDILSQSKSATQHETHDKKYDVHKDTI